MESDVASNTNEIVGPLTSELGLPPEAVFRSGLGRFLNIDISEIPVAYQERVLAIVTDEFGSVARRNNIGFSAMNADMVDEALRHVRITLLGDPTLPNVVKSFIDDHCAC